ncbi:hypothetical protein [Sphingomonas hankookensis]|uniref:hypothetical protein n=1 Tax=Sphingomonas hankookensis TaxID=563996 RepID=UPI003D302DF3
MSEPDEDRRRAIDHATRSLATARMAWRQAQPNRRHPADFPRRAPIARAVELLADALFPARIGGFTGPAGGEDAFVAALLADALALLDAAITAEFAYWRDAAGIAAAPDRPGRSCGCSPARCRGCGHCSIPTSPPSFVATRRRAAWTRS